MSSDQQEAEQQIRVLEARVAELERLARSALKHLEEDADDEMAAYDAIVDLKEALGDD